MMDDNQFNENGFNASGGRGGRRESVVFGFDNNNEEDNE
jgi:hypothetical protein